MHNGFGEGGKLTWRQSSRVSSLRLSAYRSRSTVAVVGRRLADLAGGAEGEIGLRQRVAT